MELDLLAAQQILDNIYMDDCITGSSEEDVRRMKGHLMADSE